MSDPSQRNRKQTLIITEGNHEKYKLFKLLMLSFPELRGEKITEENIIVYQSNIYNLHQKICNEYGLDWKEQDIDLPKCVSKWKGLPVELTKRDFTDILLIFDYERHDPYFSEPLICEFQDYFSDVNDNGKLYLNYPMVESYFDMDLQDFPSFLSKKCNAFMQKGSFYKNQVKRSSAYEAFSFLSNMVSYIDQELCDKEKAIMMAIYLLKQSGDNLQRVYFNYLKQSISENQAITMSYVLQAKIQNLKYDCSKESYFSYMRHCFLQSAIWNMRKAGKLQGESDSLTGSELKDFHDERLDLKEILIIQNDVSRNQRLIWILNTSLFILAEYRFFWELINAQ